MTIELTWQVVVTGILAVCGGITAIGGALAVVASWISKLKSPEKIQNDRLDFLEKEVLELQNEVGELNRKNKDTGDILGLILDSQFALLSHGINGNSISEMEASRARLQKFLIDSRGEKND